MQNTSSALRCAADIVRNGAIFWGALLALALPLILPARADADTLDRIKTAGKVVMGYREDARPFSFKDEGGQPAGFSVVLCQKIAEDLKSELALPNIAIEWSPITIDDRTTALQQGRIDILCGADTVSLERRRDVSFSIPIYQGGIGGIASAYAPQALRDILEGKPATGPVWRGSPARILNQRTFAVVAGSSAEPWLAERIRSFQIDVKVVPVENYAAGIKKLADGEVDVLFGERSILVDAAATQLADGNVVALKRQFTQAPIALAIARDNDSLRLVIDRSLSRIYANPDFRELFVKWFGAGDVDTLVLYQMCAPSE